jgi:hypothetical protein
LIASVFIEKFDFVKELLNELSFDVFKPFLRQFFGFSALASFPWPNVLRF